MTRSLNRVALLFLLCSLAWGCSSSRNDKVAFLESLFPRLTAMEFRGLWNDPECQFLAVDGRSYTSDAALCTVGYEAGMGALEPFDAQATAQLNRLVAEFKAGGVNISAASMKPTTDGGVAEGTFFVDGACDAYVYSPSWTSLPIGSDDDPGSAAAIDRDWFWVDHCG